MSASPLRVQQMLFCRLAGPGKIKYEGDGEDRKKIKEQKCLVLMVWIFFNISRVARGKKIYLPKVSIAH